MTWFSESNIVCLYIYSGEILKKKLRNSIHFFCFCHYDIADLTPDALVSKRSSSTHPYSWQCYWLQFIFFFFFISNIFSTDSCIALNNRILFLLIYVSYLWRYSYFNLLFSSSICVMMTYFLRKAFSYMRILLILIIGKQL